MGITSCLGNSLDDVSQSLKDCKSGIKFSDKYKEIGMKSNVCGRPDLDPAEFIDRKQIRFMGNNCKYAYIAMQQAVEDSGLTPEVMASPRVGRTPTHRAARPLTSMLRRRSAPITK